MGVYNPLMEMPKACNKCIVKGCLFSSDAEQGKRHPRCPLIEVKPPHGDLVDRDEIMVYPWFDADGEHVDIETKTIIPAEEKNA